MDKRLANNPFDAPEAGASWSERAGLPPLAAVLDPADERGGKNRLIDRVHKRALRSAAGDIRGCDVLDFGCGTGRLSEWLVDHGANVDGVDVTPEMVAVARSSVPAARFQVIDGSTLPFLDARFDIVLTAYVLQYYVEADSRIVLELNRVLRGGGRLLAIEQITETDIGRGGTIGAYEEMLDAAGFNVLSSSIVRSGHSRVTAWTQHRPILSRLPGTAWLVMLEARALATQPLIAGRYADALFHATKQSSVAD